jgi:hypothetical protein
MGGLLKTPSAPAPDPEITKAQERTEARLAEDERTKLAQIAARRRARQAGGQRLLLSSIREDAEKGIQETLG